MMVLNKMNRMIMKLKIYRVRLGMLLLEFNSNGILGVYCVRTRSNVFVAVVRIRGSQLGGMNAEGGLFISNWMRRSRRVTKDP